MEQIVLDALTQVFDEHMEDALEAGHDAYGEAVEKYGAHSYGLKMAQSVADAAILDHLHEQVKPMLDFGN